MTTIRQWLEDHRKECPDRDTLVRACSKALGVGIRSVRNRAVDVFRGQQDVVVTIPVPGGFKLGGARISDKRPQGDFRSLRSGYGYMVAELAEKWGMTPETVRKRARESGALRYAEVDGEWIQCVVNPGGSV